MSRSDLKKAPIPKDAHRHDAPTETEEVTPSPPPGPDPPVVVADPGAKTKPSTTPDLAG